jgi:nucleoside-diphosphate-sugar epimerase
MDLKTNIVLVTGGLGWLGTSLIQALTLGLADCEDLKQPQSNLQIRCLVLPGQDTSEIAALSEKIEIYEGDLQNPQDCTRFCEGAIGGILFHTAGVIHPKKISEFYQVNVQGTQNLLSAAVQAKLKRAVVVSSNSPCGCNPHSDHLFDEHSPYNPYMNYGRSKMQMEQNVQVFYQNGQLETAIVRPPWFYGPNQPPRQTLFFQMIRDGKAPIVGNGENLRSMAYVDNICQGLLLAAVTERANGQVYWIADEQPYSMNNIIDTVERLLESEFGQTCAHKRLKLPGIASEIAFYADGSLQALGLYHQKIHVLSEMNKTIACSVAKAKNELNYSPKVFLEEGMRRSLSWIFQRYSKL